MRSPSPLINGVHRSAVRGHRGQATGPVGAGWRGFAPPTITTPLACASRSYFAGIYFRKCFADHENIFVGATPSARAYNYTYVVPRKKKTAIRLVQTQLLSWGEKARLRETIVSCSESQCISQQFQCRTFPSPPTSVRAHAHARSSSSEKLVRPKPDGFLRPWRRSVHMSWLSVLLISGHVFLTLTTHAHNGNSGRGR